MEISTYQQQSLDFLTKTNTTIKVEFSHNGKHFEDDKDVRDIYNVVIKRGNRQFSFKFGQSIISSQYYQDPIQSRTYTLNGSNRTGGYGINDLDKYKSCQKLTLVKGTPPDEYSILSCLQKYDVGNLEDFCSEFGYDIDSKKAKKTYKAVIKEYDNVCKIWTEEEIELLQEIN